MTEEARYFREFCRQGAAGVPLEPHVFAWARESLRPPAARRAERDNLIRAAAALLPEDCAWAKAGELAKLARETRRRPPRDVPDLDTAAGCVQAALLTYPGRGLSRRQVYRLIAIDHIEMANPSAASSQTKGDSMTYYGKFQAGLDSREKFIRGGCAAIITRSGHASTIVAGRRSEHLGDHLRNVELDPGDLASWSMTELAQRSLALAGEPTRGLDRYQTIRRALEFRGPGQTTSDFQVMLENAIAKIFVGRYAVTPATWPQWCGRKSVNDFKPTGFFRPGSFGSLDPITEAGEFKTKTIPEAEKSTITASTKGNVVEITDRALANNDLAAFEDLAANLGEAAAYSVEADVSALLTAASGSGVTLADGSPLFHANHANIGPTGAMSAGTLDGARATMAKQKGPGGHRYVGFRPALWLGPSELAGQARALNDAQYVPGAKAAAYVRGLVKDAIDSEFLSAASATRHYLLADPVAFPAVAVAFLEGKELPRIESRNLFSFAVLSVRCSLDYGVGVLDHRAIVTCAGQ